MICGTLTYRGDVRSEGCGRLTDWHTNIPGVNRQNRLEVCSKVMTLNSLQSLPSRELEAVVLARGLLMSSFASLELAMEVGSWEGDPGCCSRSSSTTSLEAENKTSQSITILPHLFHMICAKSYRQMKQVLCLTMIELLAFNWSSEDIPQSLLLFCDNPLWVHKALCGQWDRRWTQAMRLGQRQYGVKHKETEGLTLLPRTGCPKPPVRRGWRFHLQLHLPSQVLPCWLRRLLHLCLTCQTLPC